jgi:hypothetical protein
VLRFLIGNSSDNPIEEWVITIHPSPTCNSDALRAAQQTIAKLAMDDKAMEFLDRSVK